MGDEYTFRLYSENEDGDRVDQVDLTDGASFAMGESAVDAPPPRQKVADGAGGMYRHGSDVVRARYENSAVDVRNLTIIGQSTEGLAANVQRLMRLLEKARLRQERGWGERVYVERDLRTYPHRGPLRKEVYRGELSTPREHLGQLVKSDYVMEGCRLELVCYPFWQGAVTSVVSGQTVNNHYCQVYPPGYQHYLDVDAEDLPGDAPCLMRVRMTNPDSCSAIKVRMGIKLHDDPQGFAGVYQCEDYTIVDGALFSAADASCQTCVKVTPANTIGAERVRITVPGSSLNKGIYRVLLRATASAGSIDAYVRMNTEYLGDPSGTCMLTVWGSDWVDVPACVGLYDNYWVIADLGILEVPPMRTGGDPPANYYFEIWTRQTPVNGIFHLLDYLMLLPVEGGVKLVEMDWCRVLGYGMMGGVGQNEVLEFNGFLHPPLTRVLDASGNWANYGTDDLGFAGYLQPDEDHRIFFSTDKAILDTPVVGENDVDEPDWSVDIDVIPQFFSLR